MTSTADSSCALTFAATVTASMRQISLSVLMDILQRVKRAKWQAATWSGPTARSGGMALVAEIGAHSGSGRRSGRRSGRDRSGWSELPSSRGRASPRRAGSGIDATSACV